MKKIIIALFILFAGFGITNAQKTPAKTPAKTAAKIEKKADKKEAKMDKMEDKKKSSGMKKDGTPDMRMKENKMKPKATTPAGPTKKDGSADMRYKANKKK